MNRKQLFNELCRIGAKYNNMADDLLDGDYLHKKDEHQYGFLRTIANELYEASTAVSCLTENDLDDAFKFNRVER